MDHNVQRRNRVAKCGACLTTTIIFSLLLLDSMEVFKLFRRETSFCAVVDMTDFNTTIL
jgi:hypothetical protein